MEWIVFWVCLFSTICINLYFEHKEKMKELDKEAQ